MSKIGDIKDRIETELQALKTAGTIADYERLRFNKPYMDLNQIGAFPYAVLAPPSMEDTAQLDNRHAERVAVFTLDVVFRVDNLQTDNEIEDTLEAIMDHFDNQSDDLTGTANGGIETAATSPAFESDARTFVIASVILRVHFTYQMTF